MERFYYYTGPVTAEGAEFTTPEEQAAAKALVRRMHRLSESIERGEQSGKYSKAVEERIKAELTRREQAGRAALIRVLQCSKTELDQITIPVFDSLPDILVIEKH